jgi:hypothetical protein
MPTVCKTDIEKLGAVIKLFQNRNLFITSPIKLYSIIYMASWQQVNRITCIEKKKEATSVYFGTEASSTS